MGKTIESLQCLWSGPSRSIGEEHMESIGEVVSAGRLSESDANGAPGITTNGSSATLRTKQGCYLF